MNIFTENNKNARVAICGSVGVGKTSIFRQLTGRQQEHEYCTTFGVDLGITDTKSSPFVITFYDFSGNPAHHDLTLEYIKKSDLLLMVYDVYDISTLARLENLYKKYLNVGWLGEIILIGNKIDTNTNIGINNYAAAGAQFARNIKVPFVIISAKTGQGIDNLRNTILSSLTPNNIFTQAFYSKHAKNKYCCCSII